MNYSLLIVVAFLDIFNQCSSFIIHSRPISYGMFAVKRSIFSTYQGTYSDLRKNRRTHVVVLTDDRRKVLSMIANENAKDNVDIPDDSARDNVEYGSEDYAQNLSQAIGNLFQLSKGSTATGSTQSYNSFLSDNYNDYDETHDNLLKANELELKSISTDLPEFENLPEERVDDEYVTTNSETDGQNLTAANSCDDGYRDALAELLTLTGANIDFSSFPFEVAPELDPETYSGAVLNYDGSIGGTNFPPIAPSVVNMPPPDGISFAKDVAAGSETQTKQDQDFQYGSIDPEELHRRIMKQEEGFEGQTAEFKDALFSKMQNRTKVEEATKLRRSQLEWRTKELKALKELEKEMEGFEEILEEKQKKREDKQHRTRQKGASQENTARRLSTEMTRPIQGRQQPPQPRQSVNAVNNLQRSGLPNALNGSSYSSNQQEFYRREMNRYKDKAEKAEKEILRLRIVVESLEKALSAALDRTPNDIGFDEYIDDIEAESSEDLPEGWVRLEDPECGEVFYMNELTGEMTYKIL